MENILENMETIDDDCDVHGVHFVKISDPAAAYHYGITTLPTLVYFKNSVPNLFDGESSALCCSNSCLTMVLCSI